MNNFAFFPESISLYGDKIDLLYFALVGISLFFIIVIVSMIIFFCVKYRKREGHTEAIHTVEGPYRELIWASIPLVIGLFLFAWGAKLFLELYQPPKGEVTEIFVVGKQWMWKFQHPDGRAEINTLHIPIHKPIKLSMISQDVIHSLFLPALRVKHDVLPGRYTTLWFTANKVGESHIFCAEYCGTEHSLMGGKLIALSQEDYETWLQSPMIENGPSRDGALLSSSSGALNQNDPVARGKALLESLNCRTCHKPDSATIAPILENIWGTKQPLEKGGPVLVNNDYVRESILNPTAKIVKGYMPVMPSYQGQIKEDEINGIIKYLQSSKSVSQ